MIEDIS